MKIIEPSFEIFLPCDAKDMIKNVAKAARTCYKSEINASEEADKKLIKNLIKNKHHAMLEHASFTVKFICDRGVSHEIVRHRVASYAQESTRYCNYGKISDGITFIEPIIFKNVSLEEKEKIADGMLMFFDDSVNPDPLALYSSWYWAMVDAENAYDHMLEFGATPEIARSVLPNSLKTEIVMTANIREWRHFLSLRAVGETGKPHPEIQRIARPLLRKLYEIMPIFFEDLYKKDSANITYEICKQKDEIKTDEQIANELFISVDDEEFKIRKAIFNMIEGAKVKRND